jgi:hypothetical protein
VKNPEARRFYETEALRGGWSERQLDRQISTLFYERTALSRDKAAMLTKGARARPEDRVSADEEVKDPLVLEFLNLKDEYSESELEEMLLRHLEKFLLELGAILRLSAGSGGCASGTNGIGWICYFSTADCGASWSSTCYVVDHIRDLLWRRTLCGVGIRAAAQSRVRERFAAT